MTMEKKIVGTPVLFHVDQIVGEANKAFIYVTVIGNILKGSSTNRYAIVLQSSYNRHCRWESWRTLAKKGIE